MERERSIVVFGAGAVGGYIGGKLAGGKGAPRVTLVARAPTVDAIRSRGLRLKEHGQEYGSQPAAVTSAVELSPPDLVVLTVRSYDVAGVLPDLERLLGSNTLVLGMQNGVGTEEALGSAVGRDRVLVGTITAAVRTQAPGIFERVSESGGVALAAMQGEVPGWVAALFAQSGLPSTSIEDYRSLRWSKLLLNMLGAATSSILDESLAEVVANRAIFDLERRAFEEAAGVMDVLRIGAVSLPGYPVPLTRALMRLPLPISRAIVGRRLAHSRGGRSPAMRGDLRRGKTEVCWLNGAVVHAGTAAQVDTPVNAALTDLIEDLSAQPDRRAAFRGDPARLLAFMRERGVRL